MPLICEFKQQFCSKKQAHILLFGERARRTEAPLLRWCGRAAIPSRAPQRHMQAGRQTDSHTQPRNHVPAEGRITYLAAPGPRRRRGPKISPRARGHSPLLSACSAIFVKCRSRNWRVRRCGKGTAGGSRVDSSCIRQSSGWLASAKSGRKTKTKTGDSNESFFFPSPTRCENAPEGHTGVLSGKSQHVALPRPFAYMHTRRAKVNGTSQLMFKWSDPCGDGIRVCVVKQKQFYMSVFNKSSW